MERLSLTLLVVSYHYAFWDSSVLTVVVLWKEKWGGHVGILSALVASGGRYDSEYIFPFLFQTL